MDSVQQITASPSVKGFEIDELAASDSEVKEYMSVGKSIPEEGPGDEVDSTGDCKAQKSRHLESPSLSTASPLATTSSSQFGNEASLSLISRKTLWESAQEEITGINTKRKDDSKMMIEFRTAMEQQVSKTCDHVEARLVAVYKQEDKHIQSKLQEIFNTLERIDQLETELLEFRHALNNLFQEVQ